MRENAEIEITVFVQFMYFSSNLWKEGGGTSGTPAPVNYCITLRQHMTVCVICRPVAEFVDVALSLILDPTAMVTLSTIQLTAMRSY